MMFDTGATHTAGKNIGVALHHSPVGQGSIETQAGSSTIPFYLVQVELQGLEQPAGAKTFVEVPSNWDIPSWAGFVAEGSQDVIGMNTLRYWGVKFDPRTGKFSKA
jgi:predicted aspartyl protease